MPVDLRYSYEFYRRHESWTMRYAPEVTAIAMIDWPTPNTSGSLYNQRKRVYGSGVSPAGFQWSFLPLHRVQPFFSGAGGFIYFSDRVLSPQGSQWMYTIDYGTGLNFFRHGNQAITLGYRYQHLSNGDISHHNPGTDASTFYVGISRFHTKGYQRPERDLR
jgi:opacity protein-like surface antigen